VVKLDEIVTSMDRDLVLNIEVIEPYKARLIAKVFDPSLLFFLISNFFKIWIFQKSNGSAALMLSLVPSFKLEEQKAELIFDCIIAIPSRFTCRLLRQHTGIWFYAPLLIPC